MTIKKNTKKNKISTKNKENKILSKNSKKIRITNTKNNQQY